jgi:hypothetical protein
MTDASISHVSLDSSASNREVVAVRESLHKYGFDAEVEPDYEARAAALVPWIVLVALGIPVGSFLRAFGAEAGKAAGRDAYELFKAWVREVWDARRPSESDRGSVVLNDPAGTTVVLNTGLADDALDALARLDWDMVEGDYLTWDADRGAWRDVTRR